MCSAENPGYVLDVKLPVINKVRDKYFTDVFTNFGHQTVPDVKSGDIKAYDIVVDLLNSESNNLKVGFDQEKNALYIEVLNTEIKVKANFKYKKSIVKLKGSIELSGKITAIKLNIGSDKLEDGNFYIPQINMDYFDLDMSKSEFKLKLKCKGCPGKVEELISKYAKDPLVKAIRKELNKELPKKLVSVGNSLLKESYPRTTQLYKNLDIATAMTGSIEIKSDHIQIPLDGTIFSHEKGYHRSGSAPDIPVYNPEDPGETMMFFSTYLITTLQEVVNDEIQHYKLDFLGTELDFEVDPSKGKTEFKFEEGDFSLKCSPTIISKDYEFSLQMTTLVKLNPIISNGDSENMLSITPRLDDLQMSSLVLTINGKTYDLAYFLGKFS